MSPPLLLLDPPLVREDRRKKRNGNLTMAKKGSSCDLCHGSNLASICIHCVNNSLGDFRTSLRSLKNFRNSLYFKLCDGLMAKRRADEQIKWRMSKNDKIKELKERLNFLNNRIRQEKSKVDEVSKNLNSRYQLLNYAHETLEKNQSEVLEKFNKNIIHSHELALMAITSERLHKQAVVIKQIFRLFPLRRVIADERKDGSHVPYDQICNARLPKGLDPHSVPSDELAASLGYMVQLLNLVVPNLAAPALHNSGFAGSCSRIWQRDSYWDARPSSQSKEYPLFIPRQNFCSSGGENSWSERSSSNFDVSSIESERKPHLDTTRSGSFNYSSASQHSMESHKELQKGISLLKKSVACITAYCSNSLCLDIPSEASTFEAFAKLLAILSSSKELQSTRKSLKVASSRSDKQAHQLNKSVWKVNSTVSNSLEESMQTAVIQSSRDSTLSYSLPSFLDYGEIVELGKYESLGEGWDLVEHPTLPPPSEVEDVEHWTRAMFIDVTRK